MALFPDSNFVKVIKEEVLLNVIAQYLVVSIIIGFVHSKICFRITVNYVENCFIILVIVIVIAIIIVKVKVKDSTI